MSEMIVEIDDISATDIAFANLARMVFPEIGFSNPEAIERSLTARVKKEIRNHERQDPRANLRVITDKEAGQ